MCTLPLLAGENVVGALRRADRRGVDRPRRARRHSSATAAARVREIVAVPGPGRGRRRRDRRPVRPPRRRAGAGRRVPAARRPLRAGGLRPVRAARPGGRDDRPAARARCSASGCSSSGGAAGCPPRAAGAARAAGPARSTGSPTRSSRPGSPGLSVRTLLACRRHRRRSSCSRWCRPRSACCRSRACFAAMAAYLPLAVRPGPGPAPPRPAARPVAGCRRQPRLRRARRAVAARGARPSSAPAGRRSCASRSARSRDDYRLTGRFDDCLDRLKDAAGRPGRRPGRREPADRPRGRRHRPRPPAAHPVGRSCARTPAPAPSSRPGRPGPSTPPGSRWPRRGSCWPCCRRNPESVGGLLHARPACAVLAVGGALTAVAYWAMVRIGRLPEDERVLR